MLAAHRPIASNEVVAGYDVLGDQVRTGVPLSAMLDAPFNPLSAEQDGDGFTTGQVMQPLQPRYETQLVQFEDDTRTSRTKC